MRQTIRFPQIVVALSVLLHASLGHARRDDDKPAGHITFVVDGMPVKMPVHNAVLSDPLEKGKADGFELNNYDDDFSFTIQGDFDVDGDGKIDAEKDKLALEDRWHIKPAPILKKAHPLTPSAKEDVTFVEVPGLGDCRILSGSLTVTSYKSGRGDADDRWAGTMALKLRTKKGATRDVAATFDTTISIGR